MKPKLLRAELVCHYGTANCPLAESETIVVADSHEARTEVYWRDRLPGVSLSVTLWPEGWAQGQRFSVMRLFPRGEIEAPEVPIVKGSAPNRVRILLPHGVTRQADITPLGDGKTYTMHLKPGDTHDAEAWEEMVPAKAPMKMPGSEVLRGVLRRQMKKRAKGGE